MGREFQGESKSRIPENSFFRAVYMVVPFVVFFLAGQIITLAGMKLIDAAAEGGMPGDNAFGIAAYVREHSATLAVCINMLAVLGGGVVLYLLFRRTDGIPRRQVRGAGYAWVILAGILLAMGLNLVISHLYLAMNGNGELYEKASYNSSIPFGLAILLYVFVSPMAEEILFRWLLYGRIAGILGAKLAVLLTAVFFGFYHGNLLQGIYAACMGIFLALLLFWSDQFWLPVLFHMAANAAVYLTPTLPGKAYELVVSPMGAVLFTIAGLGSMIYLRKLLRVGKDAVNEPDTPSVK